MGERRRNSSHAAAMSWYADSTVERRLARQAAPSDRGGEFLDVTVMSPTGTVPHSAGSISARVVLPHGRPPQWVYCSWAGCSTSGITE